MSRILYSMGRPVRSFGCITCPRCGLALRVSDGSNGQRLSVQYDVLEWERRCKVPTLGSPVVCLMMENRALQIRAVQWPAVEVVPGGQA
jgi:hypothetical protein